MPSLRMQHASSPLDETVQGQLLLAEKHLLNALNAVVSDKKRATLRNTDIRRRMDRTRRGLEQALDSLSAVRLVGSVEEAPTPKLRPSDE